MGEQRDETDVLCSMWINALVLLCTRHDAETRWVTCNKARKHAQAHQKLHVGTLQLYKMHSVFHVIDCIVCQYFLDTLVFPAAKKIAY